MLTLVIMIITCSPKRTLVGAPAELSITNDRCDDHVLVIPGQREVLSLGIDDIAADGGMSGFALMRAPG